MDTSLHDHELKLAWGKRTTLSGRGIMSGNRSRNQVDKFGLNYAVCKELFDCLINKFTPINEEIMYHSTHPNLVNENEEMGHF